MIDKKAKRSVQNQSDELQPFDTLLSSSALSLRVFGTDITTFGKENQASLPTPMLLDNAGEGDNVNGLAED